MENSRALASENVGETNTDESETEEITEKEKRAAEKKELFRINYYLYINLYQRALIFELIYALCIYNGQNFYVQLFCPLVYSVNCR